MNAGRPENWEVAITLAKSPAPTPFHLEALPGVLSAKWDTSAPAVLSWWEKPRVGTRDGLAPHSQPSGVFLTTVLTGPRLHLILGFHSLPYHNLQVDRILRSVLFGLAHHSFLIRCPWYAWGATWILGPGWGLQQAEGPVLAGVLAKWLYYQLPWTYTAQEPTVLFVWIQVDGWCWVSYGCPPH